MRSFCNDGTVKYIFARHLRINDEDDNIIDGTYYIL